MDFTVRALAVLLCAATATAADCDIQIEGQSYKAETILSNSERITGLAVENTKNMLYFSYSKNHKHVCAKLNLENGELQEIEELTGLCKFTVDPEKGQVYAGCGGFSWGQWQGAGLHKLDSETGKFVSLGEDEKHVRFVHYKQVLYYSAYTEFLLYTFSGGQSSRVDAITAAVEGLVINKNADRIFSDHGFVYRQSGEGGDVATFFGLWTPRALAVNKAGSAYACGFNNIESEIISIMRLDDTSTSVTKLLDVTDCTSLTFDKQDNIIYAKSDSIIRLSKC